MFFKYFYSLNVYITFLIAVVAILGDYIVAHLKIHIFQAIFDNATHAIIGGLSWFLVCINYKTELRSSYVILEIGICSFLSSFIDVDHFIAAKSLSLTKATHLSRRPLLHCSTFPLLTCILFLLLSYIFQWPVIKRYTLIVFTAFASHHTRDATRRGYWLYWYGSTPPIPYGVYVLITCIIPYFVYYTCKYTDVDSVGYRKLSVI
ncbi:transmembrane protein 267 [Anoplophora glabripennis]|uniref:transmembrane protein 267 n=1 Tax=Anoplophora glabripennis TaxID=217634 RepID=UPI0008758148|nr:transmembrane protein 267 [Anoplophora glabripennis]